ncbi:MAG TPA: Smr/MutS family protein [Burkholderiaceae bacterium]
MKALSELGALRDALRARADAEREKERRARAARAEQEREARVFRDAVAGALPLQPPDRFEHPATPAAPRPRQREADERAALAESISDEIDVERLLETDAALSFRRDGVGHDVPARLRRGHWVVQRQIDLHGLRVDEAREALAAFVADAHRRGLRCLRVIHGKGLGSAGKEPVLKAKVPRWLVQRDEVLAFCQARPTDGGAGALVVLLRPGG